MIFDQNKKKFRYYLPWNRFRKLVFLGWVYDVAFVICVKQVHLSNDSIFFFYFFLLTIFTLELQFLAKILSVMNVQRQIVRYRDVYI